jgi:phosphate butyryltransferase
VVNSTGIPAGHRANTYFAKGESGGIVTGAPVPLILLSRAEPPITTIRSIAIAVLAADPDRCGRNR